MSIPNNSDCIGEKIKNRGYNMQTATGRCVFPRDLQVGDICLEDIARSLSRVCRFNGHLKHNVEHYSVAQHSVLVSNIVPREYAREGLLHDATEAYVGDMVRPIKVTLPEYIAMEEEVWKVVCAAFSLETGYWAVDAAIKHADNIAVSTEKRDLLSAGPTEWGPLPEPHPNVLKPLNAFAAYYHFMRRARELNIE